MLQFQFHRGREPEYAYAGARGGGGAGGGLGFGGLGFGGFGDAVRTNPIIKNALSGALLGGILFGLLGVYLFGLTGIISVLSGIVGGAAVGAILTAVFNFLSFLFGEERVRGLFSFLFVVAILVFLGFLIVGPWREPVLNLLRAALGTVQVPVGLIEFSTYLRNPDKFYEKFATGWELEPLNRKEEVLVNVIFDPRSIINARADVPIDFNNRVIIKNPSINELELQPRCLFGDQPMEVEILGTEFGSIVAEKGDFDQEYFFVCTIRGYKLAEGKEQDTVNHVVFISRPVIARVLWPISTLKQEFIGSVQRQPVKSRMLYDAPVTVTIEAASQIQPFTEKSIVPFLVRIDKKPIRGKLKNIKSVKLDYEAETAQIMTSESCDFIKDGKSYVLKGSKLTQINDEIAELEAESREFPSQIFKCALLIKPEQQETPQISMMGVTLEYEFEQEEIKAVIVT